MTSYATDKDEKMTLRKLSGSFLFPKIKLPMEGIGLEKKNREQQGKL